MSRSIRSLTLAFGVAVLGAPILLSAQPGQGAGGERPGAVSRLLNARRQLDLTPRQIIQLDSLERIQYAERQQFNERMRGARDSMTTRARSGTRTPGARDSMQTQARARMEAERPQLEQRRRRDSSMSAAAERILNDTQRQKVREMTAERRGYERGMRESRGPRGGQPRMGQRDGQPRAGQRGGPPGGQMDEMRGPQRPRAPGGMAPRRPPIDESEGR